MNSSATACRHHNFVSIMIFRIFPKWKTGCELLSIKCLILKSFPSKGFDLVKGLFLDTVDGQRNPCTILIEKNPGTILEDKRSLYHIDRQKILV